MTAVWCEPPPFAGPWPAPRPRKRRVITKWTRTISPALERPGAWVRVREYARADPAYQAAKELRMGRVATDRPAGEWLFRSGRIGRNIDRWGVWAWWMPTSGGAV